MNVSRRTTLAGLAAFLTLGSISLNPSEAENVRLPEIVLATRVLTEEDLRLVIRDVALQLRPLRDTCLSSDDRFELERRVHVALLCVLPVAIYLSIETSLDRIASDRWRIAHDPDEPGVLRLVDA